MNTEDRAAADTLQGILVLTPPANSDVCPGCQSWRQPGDKWCNNCLTARENLQDVCRAIVPISLCARPSELRDIISMYKGRKKDADNKADFLPQDIGKDYCARQVQLIFRRFLDEFLPRLLQQGHTWDCLTVVPSSWRTGSHPLFPLLKSAGIGSVEHLLERSDADPISHNNPNEKAFRVATPVFGKSVILLDDVFTTGASIHSAAATLSSAGASVVAGIVLARRIQPAYNLYTNAVWARQSGKNFNWKKAAEFGMAAVAEAN